jgi:hypothetical protein
MRNRKSNGFSLELYQRDSMLGDAIAVGLAVAIYECVATTICGVVCFVKGQLADLKPAAVEECSVQDDDAHEALEPAEATDEYEGSLTRVVLALKASSSSQIFLRRADVAMLVEKLTSSDHHQFASPKLHKRLTLIDGSLSSLGPQAADATLYTATLSSSSQQHDDASSMCSSVRSSDRGSYRKDYSSSSSSNYSDEQQYTPQQAAHRRASSSADTVRTESSATPQRVSMSQRPRRASSVATDTDGAAELQQQEAPATPSVAQVATAVASARALARMRAAAAASSASGGSPSSAAAATTRKRVSYSAPRKSAPDEGDSYDDYWL